MTEDLSPAISAATALREAGIRTQVYTEQKKFKAKMSYASKLGIPFAVLLGEAEIAANKVSVKNMATGQQETLEVSNAAAMIKAVVNELNTAKAIKE